MHRRRSNVGWLLASVLLLVAACHPGRPAPPAVQPVTMEALHRSGGVPVGWRFTPPPGYVDAGRQAFIDYGCVSCHTVQGEQFPLPPDEERSPGPDLTGMGSHHPPEYFVEAILNPNAVLVDGPGYLGPDGWSIMPEYPDMTLADLADLVAYLHSLTSGGGHDMRAHHAMGTASGGLAPPARVAAVYLVQVSKVTADELMAFDKWFGEGGKAELRNARGVVSFEAYVNRSRERRELITVFGFESGTALEQFRRRGRTAPQPGGVGLVMQPDEAAVFRSTMLYRAVGLSIP